MLKTEDLEILNESTKDCWSIYIIDQRPIGAFKGYIDESEKLQRYLSRLRKDLELAQLSIGNRWSRTNFITASEIVKSIAMVSIAYDEVLLSENDCNSIAKKFLSDFEEDAIFLTTGMFNTSHPLNEGLDFNINGISDSDVVAEETSGKGYLFASAVVVYDRDNIGVFCKCESD